MRLAAIIRAVISASFATAASKPSPNDAHSLETRDASSFVGRWTTWGKIDSGITPEITFHPNAKIAAEWSNNNTHINVFTTDNTGAVYTAEFDYAWKEWRAWSPVHAETKFAVGATVTMLWRGDYRLHLFITDASGGVWYAFRDDGVPEWTPWFSIHPEMKFGAGATVTAVARDAHHMDLFICDNDGAVWSTWWDGGDLEGWRPWFLIDPNQSFNLKQVTTVRAHAERARESRETARGSPLLHLLRWRPSRDGDALEARRVAGRVWGKLWRREERRERNRNYRALNR
ncbi:hypothetical protein NLG97_g6953 [Lecanicillium saksenae]|uniref:Uncharacterized protein n=1 Tax=Lecanicillium saksenae TaxID=468837 RepID=A0ACC1QRZ3_9HYPO|nr:hypothetical protein NLG97_g6953 [Lecanicillium saksenae]